MTRILALILIFALTSSRSFAREITFNWEPFEGVLGYEIRVAKDPEFKEILIRKGTREPRFTMDLEFGKYFYKVRAIDLRKKPGQWSEAVPIVIPPYPPELKLPKTLATYSYFEVPPSITFEWKATEGQPEYEIFIYKTTGKKALEARTKEPRFTTDKITEGEYFWKVRTVYDKVYESPYGEPRTFTVEKKEFSPPQLIFPTSSHAIAAYRPSLFEWKKDPITHYSDITITSVTDESAFTFTEKNIHEKESIEIPYMEPGEYSWRVVNKEAEDTEGLASPHERFLVRNDYISGGNTYVSFGMAFYSLNISSNSSGAVNSSTTTTQKSGLAQSVSAKYFLGENVGFSADVQNSSLDRSTGTVPFQKFSGSLHIRAGLPGFSQEWFLGVRQFDTFLADPSSNSLALTARGAHMGLYMFGTLSRKLRFVLSGIYAKPLSHQEQLGDLSGDHYEADLGLGYNFFDQFWFYYKYRYEKSIFELKSQGTTYSGELLRNEYLNLSVSWEY